MDRRGDLEGDEGQRRKGPQQRGRGERAAPAVEGRSEQRPVRVGLQDPQLHGVDRRIDAEKVLRREGDEWGDVEGLGVLLPQTHGALVAAVYGNTIGVDLAEGVAHLVQHKDQARTGIAAKIHRQRVEAEAEQARVAQ